MNASLNGVLVVDMAKAVHYNMSYLNSVARTKVVAESCFRLPAIEYIERHSNTGSPIFLEYTHPIYKYRRIDLSWANGKAEIPSAFLEMKYVKEETAEQSEQQRYYNDFERLASILAINKKAKCYFLASGLSINWEDCFVNSYLPNGANTQTQTTMKGKKRPNKMKVESVYNQWLSFNIKAPGKIVKIENVEKWHEEFLKQYKRRENTSLVPFKRFSTRLLWISSTDNANDLKENTITGIWEIKR